MQVLLPLLDIVSLQKDEWFIWSHISKNIIHMFSEKDGVWLICVDVSSVCRLAALTPVALHWPSSPKCSSSSRRESCLSLREDMCGMGRTRKRADILQNGPLMVQLLGVDGWLLTHKWWWSLTWTATAFHPSNVAMLKIASSPMYFISVVQETLSVVPLQYCAVVCAWEHLHTWACNTLKHWTLWLRFVYIPQMLGFCFPAHVKSTMQQNMHLL